MDTASSSGPIFSGSLSFTLDVRILSALLEGTRCHMVSPCCLLYMWHLQKAISSPWLATWACDIAYIHQLPSRWSPTHLSNAICIWSPPNITTYEYYTCVRSQLQWTTLAILNRMWSQAMLRGCPGFRVLTDVSLHILHVVSWQLSVDHIGPMTIAYWLPFHCHSQIDG